MDISNDALLEAWSQGSIPWFWKAVIQTYSHKVYDCINFTEFLRRHWKHLPNITQKKIDKLDKWSQRLFPDFREDLWNIWSSFNEDDSKTVITALNERKILSLNEGLWVKVGLNINSEEFYRDANFSTSLIDNINGKEIAILSFIILPGKEVEIIQLQWRWKYWVDTRHFHLLLQECAELLRWLWFKKLFIIKAEKLFYYRTPILVPSGVEDLDEFIRKNRQRMTLTYNVNPIRKWGWGKVVDPLKKEHYSAELNLE